ncbi:histidine kinase [Puniceibacterium sediminis]|uniref:Two-component system, NarL family, sensor histidine kinase UhpB n=1 Tax=Puniceibacterium sediminis TaxID=1608407 RepID=A0A238XX54_9RHOB|nr:histidine kinase [Puniceibacterium sediminis]SNR63575.1 two-component system, NarL family, sensor histidine kinase UhpB [Puniceibacterium sediminis]
MYLKRQVVLGIVGVQLATLAIGAGVLVFNAREAVELEVTSGAQSARALVIATLGSALQDTAPDEVLPRLADILVPPRHVDLALVDARRGLLPLTGTAEAADNAPDWFRRLVTPTLREIRIPVQVNGTLYGYVLMTTAPEDEIAEVWQDVASLFWIVALTALLSALMLGMLVHRALRPLDDLRRAMRKLREGDLTTRLGRRGSADLTPILEGFDALSESLQKAEAERALLNRRIVELGDAERRSIAMELHDEFGPCLFGLRVKASAIARKARAGADTPLAEEAETILAIVAQIQASNTRLLTTLRPMAIGQLPLLDALHDLVEAFRKTHPSLDWRIDLPTELPPTPEILDLTVYRFFQEGTTNALRHGNPQRIEIRIEMDEHGPVPLLQLDLTDDGVGMPDRRTEGRGLTAMRDRIGAVGGQLAIAGTDDGGTRLSARLPMSQANVAPTPLDLAS